MRASEEGSRGKGCILEPSLVSQVQQVGKQDTPASNLQIEGMAVHSPSMDPGSASSSVKEMRATWSPRHWGGSRELQASPSEKQSKGLEMQLSWESAC